MKVLVTGNCGYIGAHVTKLLCEHGYEVHGIDSNTSPLNDVSRYVSKQMHGSIVHQDVIPRTYDALVHLAALISVGQSIADPISYYETNIQGTINIVESVHTDHVVFGSSAAAFTPSASPYALSKFAGEQVVAQACELSRFSNLRFFNVAGSDGEFYQSGAPTHLVRIAALMASGKIPQVIINGGDYDTRDGTCIREYIHVEDVAKAVLAAIESPSTEPFECITSGVGYSNLEVLWKMREVSGRRFPIKIGNRREGDPAVLASPSKSKYVLDEKTLDEICLSAYKYECSTMK